MAKRQSHQDGTGVFRFTHTPVLPYYYEQYPAVLQTVAREGLQYVNFTLGNGIGAGTPLSLAVLPVPEPTGLALALAVVLSVGWIRRNSVRSGS